jgi:hypothetical protein
VGGAVFGYLVGMEPLRRDDTVRRLVAVFRDRESARAAADAVRQAGLSGVNVEIDAGQDELAAVRGEMYEEMQHTVAGANATGPLTREMQAGAIPGAVIATVVGAVIALPLGLIPLGDLGLGLRLLIAAGVGALVGALYGFFAGGAARWETEVSGKHLAAEDGVTVGAWVSGGDREAERVGELLRRYDPVRIDQVTPEGHSLRTVDSEDDNSA